MALTARDQGILGRTALKQRDLFERRTSGALTTARAAKQHARGKLTARERLDILLDPGSFTELDELAHHRCSAFGMEQDRPSGDGVITGFGTVAGRPVCVFAHDFTVFGGSLGEVFGQKIVKVMDLALKTGCPIVGLNDSGGARIQEGVASLALYGEIGRRNVRASGVIPQISVIMGPCAGGAVYSPAITDFIVMVEGTSHMFVTGPDVIREATGEIVNMTELGGAANQSSRSGVVHHAACNEPAALDFVKRLLSYLPSNYREQPPAQVTPIDLQVTRRDEELDSLIPDSPQQPYDMRGVVERILDHGVFLELQPLFAPNILCGFGRVEGRTVGVVANQPLRMAGVLDINASEKAARFVRTCDAFNVPVLTLVDVPGFLPGAQQEWNGIIRRGAKLAYAYAEATVPLVTVITRRAYGGGYGVMGSKHLGADINLAWPTAEVAVMGARAAVSLLFHKELSRDGTNETLRRELTEEYERTLLNPYTAADRGFIDAVIEPSTTRAFVTRALRQLRSKCVEQPSRKHGNIPL